MAKTLLMEKVEHEHGASIEEIVREMTGRGKSREAIARHLNISYWTLMNWLDKLDARFETTVHFGSEETAAAGER